VISLAYMLEVMAIAPVLSSEVPVNSRMLVLEVYFPLISLGYQFLVFQG
jgi:hypothetical protein